MQKKKNIKFKAADFAVVLLCLAGSILSGSAFWQEYNRTLTRLNDDPIGTIAFKKRTAQRKFIDRIVWDTLKQASPVYNGDTIRTIDFSEAVITFRDQTTSLSLFENTLIQIFYSEAEGARIEFSGGQLEVDSGARAVTITTVIRGAAPSEIRIEGQADLNKTDEGFILSVNEGKADLDGEEIETGNIIALDTEGRRDAKPAVAVTSFGSSAKILGAAEGPSLVNFTWITSNFNSGTSVVIEIARDRDFKRITAARNIIDASSVTIPVDNGNYWWRAYPVESGGSRSANAMYPSGTLEIIPQTPVTLVSPASSAEFEITDDAYIPLFWTAAQGASSYILEISANQNMSSPAVTRHVQGTSVTQAGLENAKWYWRVTPVFPNWVIGALPPSSVNEFTITMRTAPDARLAEPQPQTAQNDIHETVDQQDEYTAGIEETTDTGTAVIAANAAPQPESVSHLPEPISNLLESVSHLSEVISHIPEAVSHLPEALSHLPETLGHLLESVNHPPEPASQTVQQTAVNVPVERGSLFSGNGHRYEIVDQNIMDWGRARLEAERRGGYLATITSAEEQQFVENLISTGRMDVYWLGGQLVGRQWRWITDEAFEYTNWTPGQPDNFRGQQNRLSILRTPHIPMSQRGMWDDTEDIRGEQTQIGFIIEYPASQPVIVSHAVRQTAANVPAERGILFSGNGHRYEIVDEPTTVWENAKLEAERRGGYLATITSAEEQQFIQNLISTGRMNIYWLGGQRVRNQWSWVTGEAFSYRNWAPDQPDNHQNGQNRIAIMREANPSLNRSQRGQWDDVERSITRSGPSGSIYAYASRIGFIIEYPASQAASSVRRNVISYIYLNGGWDGGLVYGANDSLMEGTSAFGDIRNETIQGQSRDVITFTVNLARGSDWREGIFVINNNEVVWQLENALGVRFKVLGDGGRGWEVRIRTTDTNIDHCAHFMSFNNRNGQIVEIDVPYSRLRQPDWGRQVRFNRENIVSLEFRRAAAADMLTPGSSTIKIFDLEIY